MCQLFLSFFLSIPNLFSPFKPIIKNDIHAANVSLFYIPQESYLDFCISFQALLPHAVSGLATPNCFKCRSLFAGLSGPRVTTSKVQIGKFIWPLNDQIVQLI